MTNFPEMVALRMIHYFGDDTRRVNHSLKVHGFAKIIARMENLTAEQNTILEF